MQKKQDVSVLQTNGSGVLSFSSPSSDLKAWVNFNGTGTVAIRSSFNVSSITDNGTGNYTVNFTTALADGNYCAVFGDEGGLDTHRYQSSSTKTTSAFTVLTAQQTTSGSILAADIATIQLAIFR